MIRDWGKLHRYTRRKDTRAFLSPEDFLCLAYLLVFLVFFTLLPQPFPLFAVGSEHLQPSLSKDLASSACSSGKSSSS